MIGIFFLLLKIKLCCSKNIWQQSKLILDSKFDDINSLFVDVSVRGPGPDSDSVGARHEIGIS